MRSQSLAPFDTVVSIVTEHARETALVRLDQLIQEDPAPDTPSLCAASIIVGRANLGKFTAEEKASLERFVSEGEIRAQRLEDSESTQALFARGTLSLLRLLSDQINVRSSTRAPERVLLEGRALIERAYYMEPSNVLYELALAAALRFFPTRLKDKRKQEGIGRLEALSRQPGAIGVSAKFMLADSAIRRGQANLILDMSRELQNDLPNSACPHVLAAAAHDELGDPETAVKELETAVRKNPEDEDIKRILSHTRARRRGHRGQGQRDDDSQA